MIRPAKQSDLEEIRAIFNHEVINTTVIYENEPRSAEAQAAWYSEKMDRGLPLFVFEEDGVVMGFATFGPFRPHKAYSKTIEHSIYVRADCRQQGIGAHLLQTLIDEARRRDYHMMIGVLDSENHASIRLHRQFGFSEAGTLSEVGYKFGRWLDAIFYQLKLSD